MHGRASLLYNPEINSGIAFAEVLVIPSLRRIV